MSERDFEITEHNIVIIGCGEVGYKLALSMEYLDNETKEDDFEKYDYKYNIYFLDKDRNRLKWIKENLKSDLVRNRKYFYKSMEKALDPVEMKIYTEAHYIFICVPTPTSSNEEEKDNLDTSNVFNVAERLSRVNFSNNCLIILKSTIPIGTTTKIKEKYFPNSHILFIPEFTREGKKDKDLLQNIIGFYSSKKFNDICKEKYQLEIKRHTDTLLSYLGNSLEFVSYEEAELIKLATNTFLCWKISFANQVRDICSKYGLSSARVLKGVFSKSHIAEIPYPSLGFGGGCLPKDLKEMKKHMPCNAYFEKYNDNITEKFIKKIGTFINEKIRPDSVKETINILIWGYTFKAGGYTVSFSKPKDLVVKLLCNIINIKLFIYDQNSDIFHKYEKDYLVNRMRSYGTIDSNNIHFSTNNECNVFGDGKTKYDGIIISHHDQWYNSYVFNEKFNSLLKIIKKPSFIVDCTWLLEEKTVKKIKSEGIKIIY